jgi:predicted anti-sigma-YlaC factor YlaD
MSCDPWIEAISARADGEPLGVEERLLDAHVAACPSCRDFAAGVPALIPRRPVTPAPRMPDLSRRVAKLNALADRASRWGAVRALLAFVAVEVMVLAVPELVLGHDGDGSGHAARHVGAFGIAYAVSLLVVVVRPARARSILPTALVLALALSITAVVDVVDGRVPLLGEATHIPEILSVVLVWMLARPVPDRAAAGGAVGPLRSVDGAHGDRRSEAG